nr:hypothetical protein HK105_007654 [Polyrhizophydium stewartii]
MSIMACVLVNSVVIGLDTVPSIRARYGFFLTIVDYIFLGVFIAEMLAKLYALRLLYFKSGWNILDFLIILTSLTVWLLPEVLIGNTALGDARILRLVRLFRAVRAVRSLRALQDVSFLKSLQLILTTLFQSLPAMGSIAFVSLIVGYVFAVAGTLMYHNIDKRFADLGSTSFRLLQIMTLDRWSELYVDNKSKSDSIWYYVAIFLVLQTFIFLNLLVAVIVNNLQSSREHIEIMNRRRKRQQAANQMGTIIGEDLNEGSVENLTTHKDKIAGLVTEEFGLDNYYSPLLPWRTKELLSSFFMHLCALEHNLSLYDRQQKVFDDLRKLSPLALLSHATHAHAHTDRRSI